MTQPFQALYPYERGNTKLFKSYLQDLVFSIATFHFKYWPHYPSHFSFRSVQHISARGIHNCIPHNFVCLYGIRTEYSLFLNIILYGPLRSIKGTYSVWLYSIISQTCHMEKIWSLLLTDLLRQKPWQSPSLFSEYRTSLLFSMMEILYAILGRCHDSC